MTEAKHTPLPWKINRIASTCIESEKGRVIASCGGHQQHPGNSSPENQANTEFIVRAVNNHGMLMEALEEVYDRLEMIASEEDSEQWDDALNLAKQALAKAKVKS